MRRSAGPQTYRPTTDRVAKDRPVPAQEVILAVSARAETPPDAGRRTASYKRRLAISALAVSMVVITGCERTESVQTGLRGSSMIQLYKPNQLAKLQEVNRIPDPEPSDPYDPSFPMATEVHQNVQVLTDLNALEFARLMNAISTWVAPEEGCAYCHNPEDLASDEKFTKIVSREMLKMTRAINSNWQSHVVETGVTCWTCHRGRAIPSDIWFKTPEPVTPSAGTTGWKGGQNVAGVSINGNAALPFDPLTPFLDQAHQIAVQGTEVLPYGNRQSIKQAEWTYSLMMYMSQSLGVNCTYCHHTRAMGVWDQSTPQRVTAWHGIRMVRDLNQSYLNPLKPLYPDDRLGPEGDAPKAACATCHKGTYKPLFGQTMLDDYPSLAGVLPERLDPEAETAAIAALSGVSPEIVAMTAVPSAEASAQAEAAAESSVAEASAPTPAPMAEVETEVEPQAEAESETEADTGPSASATSAEPQDMAPGSSAEQAAAASAEVGAPTLETMTLSEIETALDTLLEKVEAVRQSLDEMAPPEPSASETDADAEAVDKGTQPGASLDDPEAGAIEPVKTLRALLAEQATQLRAAKRAVSALSESEAKIAAAEAELDREQTELQASLGLASDGSEPSMTVADRAEAQGERLKAAQQRIGALRARLDQERLALQQQLDVVRAQRDQIEGDVASRLSDQHNVALTAMERQLVAVNARLEQERLALQQQLQVVREQRGEALELAENKVDPSHHEQAIEQAETRIRATQAKLDQQQHALQQQLTLVRTQRDSAREQAAAMVPRDEHEQALVALERRAQALQARLDQNSLALQQQLAVVRDQRNQAQAKADERVAELRAIHEKALADQQVQVAALEARLEQNLHALGEQLDVVREQRDSSREQITQRVETISDAHQDRLESKQRQLAAMQARLDQNRRALQQQLDVVRDQRDAARAQAEQRIAAAMDTHEDQLETKQQRLAAMQARLDQNRRALEQQLELLREQRNAAKAQAAERVDALQSEHQAEVAELQEQIRATEERLARERETLERRLAMAREERNALVIETEARIAELTDELANERESLASLRDGHQAQVQALNQRLAEANAEAEQLRAEMQAATQQHAQALAEAKGSVTRIRLNVDAAAELGGRVTDEGILVNLGSDELRFASGSATLPPRQLPTLDRTAALLEARPELSARIQGHTDSRGSAEINQRLSQERAEAVRQALIERGIEPERLAALGAGSAEPIADNATPQGRRENRRVEIYLTAQDDADDGSIMRSAEDGGSS